MMDTPSWVMWGGIAFSLAIASFYAMAWLMQ